MTSTITLISARFDDDLSAESDQSGKPANAFAHIAGSEINWAESGRPSRKRSIRSWLTFWPNESAGVQFLEQRSDHIRLLASATDVSIGLLQPFATHGEVNWLGGQPSPLNLTFSQRPEMAAPIFIITTAGLGEVGPGLVAFGQGTHAVRSAIQDQDTVRFEAQILPDDPTYDGPTLSLWDSQSAVMEFAYKSDPHKSAMDVMNHEGILRGSFTRCVVKSFKGVWQDQQISI